MYQGLNFYTPKGYTYLQPRTGPLVEKSCTLVRLDQEPQQHTCEYTTLNERGVKPSACYRPAESVCCEKGVISDDPRLKDVTRGIQMVLDKPPGEVRYNLINDNVSQNPELSRYGKDYRDYSTVNAGEIQYYIDRDLAQPFPKPIYDVKADVVGYMWEDPMSSKKPQFNKLYSEVDYGTLSFINDSAKHREDIIARQQRTRNQQRSELFY